MERTQRKVRTGIVISDKMQKTVVVSVERAFQHPFYKKTVRATKNFKAHDENNECRVGDQVEIMETRKLSRDKRWRVVRILGKGKVRLHELPKKKEAKAAPAEAGGEKI